MAGVVSVGLEHREVLGYQSWKPTTDVGALRIQLLPPWWKLPQSTPQQGGGSVRAKLLLKELESLRPSWKVPGAGSVRTLQKQDLRFDLLLHFESELQKEVGAVRIDRFDRFDRFNTSLRTHSEDQSRQDPQNLASHGKLCKFMARYHARATMQNLGCTKPPATL